MNATLTKFRRRFFRRVLPLVLIVVLVAMFTFFDVYRVRGQSMWPEFLSGDTVVVRRAFGEGALTRWSIQVYSEAGQSGDVRLMKRVAALEGETIQLNAGDVFVGPDSDHLARAKRPPEIVEAMRVPVYPPPTGPDSSRFRVTGGRSEFAENAVTLIPETPRGKLRLAVLGSATTGASREAIVDDSLGNDGQIVPGSRPVPDVRIEVTIENIDRDGILEILHQIHPKGRDTRGLRLTPASVQVWGLGADPDEEVILAERPAPKFPYRLRMETLDGDFRVDRVEDGELRSWFSGSRNTLDHGTYSRVLLTVQGGSARVAAFDISRDVHYFWPPGLREARQIRPGHVFLIGDNVPVSRDCRHFGDVPLGALVGRVARRIAGNRR